MLKIGITGQNGFVGSYLYNTVGLNPDEFERIEFERDYFEIEEKLPQSLLVALSLSPNHLPQFPGSRDNSGLLPCRIRSFMFNFFWDRA